MIKADPKQPCIVWIASYPKSGNTWTRIFLYHLERIMNGRPREKDELNQVSLHVPYEARQVRLFEKFLGRPIQTATHRQVAAVRPRVQAAIAENAGRMVLLKTHCLLGPAFGVPLISPDVSAGAIYLVRDPRDVVVSLAAHFSLPIDEAIAMAGSHYGDKAGARDKAYEVWGTWSEHVNSWTARPHDAVLVVRYRDLVANPLEQFAAIARHLRWQPTPQQLAAAVELSSFDMLSKLEAKRGFRERAKQQERFFRKGKVGDWRRALTQAQANRIVTTHGAVMARFGWRDEAVISVDERGAASAA